MLGSLTLAHPRQCIRRFGEGQGWNSPELRDPLGHTPSLGPGRVEENDSFGRDVGPRGGAWVEEGGVRGGEFLEVEGSLGVGVVDDLRCGKGGSDQAPCVGVAMYLHYVLKHDELDLAGHRGDLVAQAVGGR